MKFFLQTILILSALKLYYRVKNFTTKPAKIWGGGRTLLKNFPPKSGGGGRPLAPNPMASRVFKLKVLSLCGYVEEELGLILRDNLFVKYFLNFFSSSSIKILEKSIRYIVEMSTGPKFPARPANVLVRPGPARNQCITKFV